MGKVRWTTEAELWLHDIHDYIARDNPAAAQRTVERIYEKAEILEEFPEIGHLYRPRRGEAVLPHCPGDRLSSFSRPAEPRRRRRMARYAASS